MKKKENFIIILLLCLFTSVDTEAKKKTFGNGLYWELNEKNGELIISGVGEMPNYKNSGESPFYKMIKNGKVYKIIIDEGITTIGDYIFEDDHLWSHYRRYCIKEVLLPLSIERIGKYAFHGNKELKNVILGNKLKTIEHGAFLGTGLTGIEIPSSVSEIGDVAFAVCKIRVLDLPKSINSIGQMAFAGNPIDTLSISPLIEAIGEGAFNKGTFDKFNGKINSLPQHINITNCMDYGISKESMTWYINSIRDADGRVIMAANDKRSIKKYTDNTDKSVCYVVEEENKKGIIKNGEWIIPLSNTFSKIEPIGSNYIKVQNNGYYGIVTFEGKEIIPTSRGYTSISNYNSNKGTFTFTKKGMKGVCDINGKEISTTRLAPTVTDIKEKGNYANAVAMTNGNKKYYKVSKSGHYGLTDEEGKVIVPTEMDALEDVGVGYLKFKLNGFWGIMDYAGKIIVDTSRGYTAIGDYVSFTKRFPYTMSGYKGEFDLAGKEISRIKVETVASNTSSSSSSSTSSSNSSSSSNSNSSSSGTQTIIVEQHGPVQVWVACGGCYGSGQCTLCGGQGRGNMSNGSCFRCGWSGRCNICAGQGGHYETQYR